jgi:hypothetical protein
VPRSSFETPEPTPTPTLASNEVGIGENVGITRDGVSWAALTVSEVVVAGSFPNPEAPGGDAPDRSGSVFVAAHVTVAALADTVSFELEGFRATVETGDEVTLAFSHLGPKPDLMPGTLEGRGDSASGWLLFEAPEAGRVRLFYDDGMATSSPLRIVLRGS